jgi:hypothetical protein
LICRTFFGKSPPQLNFVGGITVVAQKEKKPMEKYSVRALTCAFLLLLGVFFGCAATLPITSTLNDFVLLGVTVNSDEEVKFSYDSQVVDGTTKEGFKHAEATAFGVMIFDYMKNKFAKLTPDGTTLVRVTLRDFETTLKAIDSSGRQVAKFLFGGKTNYMLSAKVVIEVHIERNGTTTTKLLSGSSETTYSGEASKTNEKMAETYAKGTNEANNKVLMFLNAYFEEIGL